MTTSASQPARTDGPETRVLLERSLAFREAMLRSEERRAIAVILIIALVGLAAYGVGASDAGNKSLVAVRVIGAIAGLLLLSIQIASITLLRRARRLGTSVPTWFDAIVVAAECSVPTLVILTHIRVGSIPPYTALTTPPLLAYGLLISLTTLRLRPALCVWAGAVAAGGYVAALAYVALGLGLSPPETGWPVPGYPMAGLIVFLSGVVAAWVARQIRTHVEAALAEAETRRTMERLEHDLDVARTIQQSLLPRVSPSVPGFEIAGWNRPADQTGGDYYDWHALPDGRWLVSLADVAGHGVGPALVTAACRAYVRASSTHHSGLEALATRVNRLLADDLVDGRFVTMVNVLLDPRGGPAAILSAGHAPIVLYARASGIAQSILPHGLPLAVLPDLEIGPAQTIEMLQGDVLALVTDGIVEWSRAEERGHREEFGLHRLLESLARHAGKPAAAIIDGVVADASTFAGGVPQQDDLTLVILKATGT